MSDDKRKSKGRSEAAGAGSAEVQKYVCLAPLDHSGDHRIYPVGAVVTLEHLAPEMVQRLVDGGHVRPVAD
jgi:hypothetical protein